ncbi:DUF4259 domain-containing protein [Planomonospora sp. ID91781]|uniref:DUF4259 domain-containing protein n=1 Tax=Planomonospora sp. ID91781 TaxID=2738135 RepID=UPI0018C3773F|nr:DUF4259 domain-containing protein [Planomonospora sp. ID91781]MBG0825952.1 DUF4259 domain-containing protein [Planomonospora sp. ID91781]
MPLPLLGKDCDVDGWTPFFEGPFDSDEAADAIAELEGNDDIAAAMTAVLEEFVRDNADYAEEGQVEAALAVACLIAARISGIAPDEAAHHWLDRNPFAVSDDLRRLATAAFDLATRPDDNHLSEVRAADWPNFLEHLQPYRKALRGEPQEPPAPFVPDFSRPGVHWLQAFWSITGRGLPHDSAYAQAADRLVRAVDQAPDWLAWWRAAGLQELLVFGELVPGARSERISRGRTTAEALIGFGHAPAADEASAVRQVCDDIHKALAAAGRYLGLGPTPPLPAPD